MKTMIAGVPVADDEGAHSEEDTSGWCPRDGCPRAPREPATSAAERARTTIEPKTVSGRAAAASARGSEQIEPSRRSRGTSLMRESTRDVFERRTSLKPRARSVRMTRRASTDEVVDGRDQSVGDDA